MTIIIKNIQMYIKYIKYNCKSYICKFYIFFDFRQIDTSVNNKRDTIGSKKKKLQPPTGARRECRRGFAKATRSPKSPNRSRRRRAAGPEGGRRSRPPAEAR